MARRVPVPVVALLFLIPLTATVIGQATPAKQASTPPAAPAKWVPPLKGEGTIEVIKGKARRVGNDVVTTLKIRNTSKGALALLIVDEYWYAATGKDAISGDTQRNKALLNPGEVVEMTTRSPWKAEMNRSLHMFRHANGSIKAKAVTKFADGK